MTRHLCAIHAVTAVWTAYCTAAAWRHVPVWVGLTLAFAAATALTASVRESRYLDDVRALRVQLERAGRPTR